MDGSKMSHIAAAWVLVGLGALTGACAAQWQFVETAPDLPPPPAGMAVPPAVPAGRFEAKADAAVQLEAVAPKALPDLRSQALAIAPLSVMPEVVRQLFEREWSLAAMRRGAASFLDPRALRRVEVRRERAETKGAVKETTQWSGGIEQMAALTKVSPAALVLQIDVLDVEQLQRVVEWVYILGAQELADYAERLKAYREQQAAYGRVLRSAASGYAQRFENSKAAYDAANGSYDESGNGQRASAAVARHRTWSARYRQLLAVASAGAGLPQATEAALKANAERVKGAPSAAAAAQIRTDVKLLQVETGELLWAGRFTVVGSDVRDAAGVTLERLLDALLPASVRAAQPEVAP